MSNHVGRAVRAALLLAGCSAVAVTHAQEAPQPSGVLSDIVVTAQKREEKLQDVPIAITALDSAALEKSFSRDIQGVAQLAPNLIVDPILGNGTAAISIRGMQLNDVEKSFDPAVAVYLDGIYLANTTGALLQMADAEAVEVLRGPQGTLFGRNTIGGLLHIRRAKPTGELGGKVSLTFGRFDQFDAYGVLNLPAIADGKLKTKLSVFRQDGGGYFRNVSRNAREGDNDFTGVTLSTLFEPTDDLSLWLTLDYFDDKTPTRPVTSLTAPGEAFCPVGLTTGQLGCGAPKTDANWHRRPTTTLQQEAFVKTKAATLNGTYQATDSQRVALVLGYRDVEDDALQEFDGVAAPVFWTQRPQTSDQTSIELRLESDWSPAVRSTFGVYYFDGEYTLSQTTLSPAFFGAGPVLSARPEFTQKTKSYAGFGQIDWDVTSQLTLSVGGRYNKEKKDACGNSRLEFATGIATIVSFGSCTGAPAYDPDYVDPITGATVIQDGKETWSKFTPRVGLTYKFDDERMVYATWSVGFRSGGFNGRSTEPQSLGPYAPEEVDSFEVGAKTQWFDNRLRLNVAAFTTKYKDKQEDVVFPDPAAVTVTLVQNAAEAKLNGAEFELTAVPANGLTLSANVGILDAKYDDWTVNDLNGDAVDKSNFELRRAPKFTFGLNGQYEQPLSNGHALVYNLNYSYKDDYYIGASTFLPAAAGEPTKVEAFGTLDASVTYDADRWSVSLWGKNLTDEDWFLHVLDVGTSYVAGPNGRAVPVPGLWTFGTISPPRTYGVEMRFKF